MIDVVLPVAVILAFAAGGVLVSVRSIRLAVAVGLPLLAVLLGKLALGRIAAAEARLFPWEVYPYLEPWLSLAPASFLAGAGVHAARHSTWKRDTLLVLGGLFLVRTGYTAWTSRDELDRLDGRIGADGICLQTSEYTCGPAAAVALLHWYGIASSEREMARLCATRPGFGGTSECGLMRGLRLKLGNDGLPWIRRCSYEELTAPSLVTLRHNWLAGHCTMVADVLPDRVVLIDSQSGRCWLPRDRFERAWTGSAITLLR
jgi:hypothetical protein